MTGGSWMPSRKAPRGLEGGRLPSAPSQNASPCPLAAQNLWRQNILGSLRRSSSPGDRRRLRVTCAKTACRALDTDLQRDRGARTISCFCCGARFHVGQPAHHHYANGLNSARTLDRKVSGLRELCGNPSTLFMKYLLLLTAFFFTALASAQTTSSGLDLAVKGKFYCVVDDELVVFINGAEIFRSNLGWHQVKEINEITLKVGDRMTIQLRNNAGAKFVRLLFVAADRSVMLPVSHRAFKCLPDAEAKDFIVADWQRNSKMAKEIRDMSVESFPIKSRADYLWGDADVCAIGGIVTREMFIPVPHK